ncbi:hypothetical protein [Phocaeicola salanitronis]|uniref:hypothetical protein n=1 Tax=Phocaeicola salanitronis TaxID=376805 RepID=UPI00320B901F
MGDFFVLFAPVLRQIARYLPHHRSGNASKTHPKSSHDKFKTASYQAVAVVADDVRQFGMMKMGEYVALSNLRNGTDNQNNTGSWLVSATQMPFTTYEYSIDCSCRDKNHGATHTQMADDEGRGSIRPGWEILYNHYAKVANVGSGYTYAKQFADKLRPEGGVGEPENRYGTNSGAFDQLGWATLMLYRE